MGLSTPLPNQIVMMVPGISIPAARSVAVEAARAARSLAPKLSVASASAFTPIYGMEWFGIAWAHDYVWYQEAGIRPFTMRSLAGKLVPMWVNDLDGKEQAKNPKAKTRRTADGRVQVLIFRRAAKMGQRKIQWRPVAGKMTPVSVPASYPGAPGRIAVNRSQGILRAGDISKTAPNPGAIAQGNVGVRWRHPGLDSRRFLARGMEIACHRHSIPVGGVSYQRSGASVAQQSYTRVLSNA
jgi:hypothetical protein